MSTCVITGAGSGIGRETAIMINRSNQYQNIALLGRNIEELETTKKTMLSENQNVNVGVFQIDLIELSKIPYCIDEIVSRYETVDCLLNIAGYTDPQPILLTSAENLMQTYTVNTFAPLILTRECVRYMKKRGGKILNVGSTAGMSARPGWISYASSKAALISMSKTMTEELAEYGIKVYCVSPGRCATNLRKKLAPNEDPTTIMQPQDVAKVIVSLIAEAECCLDGQNIVIRKQIK